MERELWSELVRLINSLGRSSGRPVRCQYTDLSIVRVYLWAVLHDRPVVWATDRRHWPPQAHGMRLPSQSTMSRRLRRPGVRQWIDRLIESLRQRRPGGPIKCIDAKPLPIGGYSRDREARWGHATRGWAKGYKLFAVWAEGACAPLAWRVGPMSQAETTVACELIDQLEGRGVLLADALYDVNRLFELAGQRGHQLLTPRKFPDKPIGVRARSPHRLRGIDLMTRPSVLRLHARRLFIEQRFGHLTCHGGGLAPLPAWVRRRHRVELWVAAKLLIHAARHTIRQRRQFAA